MTTEAAASELPAFLAEINQNLPETLDHLSHHDAHGLSYLVTIDGEILGLVEYAQAGPKGYLVAVYVDKRLPDKCGLWFLTGNVEIVRSDVLYRRHADPTQAAWKRFENAHVQVDGKAYFLEGPQQPCFDGGEIIALRSGA